MRWPRRGRETSASVVDGQAVWFWRPFAGVKFARRQGVARMTGSTKQLVPGESAEQAVKPLRGECRVSSVPPL